MDIKDANFEILSNYDPNNHRKIKKHLDLLVVLKEKQQKMQQVEQMKFLDQVKQFKLEVNIPEPIEIDP